MTTTSTSVPDVDPTGVRPLVNLREDHARVEPGQTARANLDVRNVGTIVETYDFIVLGPAAPWTTVVPESVSLFPGEEASAVVNFRPPMSSSVVAGEYIIGIQAMSQVRRDNAASDEIAVTVAPFYRFSTEIGRNMFAVRRKARLLVQVTNDGNSRVTYKITADDPEGYLSVTPEQELLTLAPGESQWVGILVKVGPRIFGSSFDTRSFIARIVPIVDEDNGMPIVDPQIEDARGSVMHKPFIRLRLGLFGRLVVLIGLLAVIGLFIYSRYIATSPPASIGAPPVPSNFAATANTLGQVILTWDQSPGATGYTIYAVGSTGDPVPTPEPTVIVEQPTATPALFVPASAPVTSQIDTSNSLASPLCEGCSEVVSVDAGTSRYVVEKVNPGDACYRIAALVDVTQSLYSTPVCTYVADPAGVDLDGDGIPDGIDTTGDGFPDTPMPADAAGGAGGAGEETPPAPCPPVNFEARAVSSSSLAILWAPATTPPKGMVAPEPADPAALRMRGGEKSGDAAMVDTSNVCDPAVEPTGWTIQRKIFTGWSDVIPAPKADDTALEVPDLNADTKYCFRMKTTSANGDSVFTKKFCARTDPLPEETMQPLPPVPTAPEAEFPAPSTDQPSTRLPLTENPY